MRVGCKYSARMPQDLRLQPEFLIRRRGRRLEQTNHMDSRLQPKSLQHHPAKASTPIRPFKTPLDVLTAPSSARVRQKTPPTAIKQILTDLKTPLSTIKQILTDSKTPLSTIKQTITDLKTPLSTIKQTITDLKTPRSTIKQIRLIRLQREMLPMDCQIHRLERRIWQSAGSTSR